MPIIDEGVYEERIVQTIGTMGTARTQEILNYYLARSVNENLVRIQLMDIDDQPLPIIEQVAYDEFIKRFTYKPDYLAGKKTPNQRQVEKAIATAEAHVKRKEYFSAEYEYSKALKLDEDNVRANFGIGKVYLIQGEMDKAKETFRKLARIDAVFEEKNKHIFNELGIELRRLGLYENAIEYYLKALSIVQDDENLFFNCARAHFENGDHKNALVFLGKVFALKSDHPEGRHLLRAINKPPAAG